MNSEWSATPTIHRCPFCREIHPADDCPLDVPVRTPHDVAVALDLTFGEAEAAGLDPDPADYFGRCERLFHPLDCEPDTLACDLVELRLALDGCIAGLRDSVRDLGRSLAHDRRQIGDAIRGVFGRRP